MEAGTRVVRGPNGAENQDGGVGSLRTVDRPSHQVVWIHCDGGRTSVHQVGQNNKHDLVVRDETGTTHTHIRCDGCGQSPLVGLRWHCLDCPNYDLCTTCYMTDVHDLSHSFQRINDTDNNRMKRGEPVGMREGVVKHPAKGIFPGATVKQNGGDKKEGFVVEVCDWSEGGEKKNAVRVQWFRGKRENLYRVGYGGKFDLQCAALVNAGHYYRDHLPSVHVGKTKAIQSLSTWDKVYMFMTAAAKVKEMAEHAESSQHIPQVPSFKDFKTEERQNLHERETAEEQRKLQRESTQEQMEHELQKREEEELAKAMRMSLSENEPPENEEVDARKKFPQLSETGAGGELHEKEEIEDAECEHHLMEAFVLKLLDRALANSENASEKIQAEDDSIPAFVQWILSRAFEALQQSPDSTGTAAAGPDAYWRPHASIMDQSSNLDENEILQRVLEISAKEFTDSKSSVYQNTLRQHISSVMAVWKDGDTPRNLLHVRREYAFKDGIKHINRSSFIPRHGLSVIFTDGVGASEGAIDGGGPTREFLRIALHKMYNNHGLFGGPEHNKVLLLNSEARSMHLYRSCGKFLAISLCNGGGVENCLSKAVYDFLVYGEESSHPQIVDVVDVRMQDTLTKIKDCHNKEAFEKLVYNDEIAEQISQCGYQSLPSFENKSALIDVLCRYHVLDRPRSALEQFKEGLKMLGVLDLITLHPEPFENLFCYRHVPLSPAVFEEQFQVMYGDLGTPLKKHQEHVVLHWLDYLRESHAGATKATLADILRFATGANRVPPLGFADPPASIGFWENVRPRANTCINRLYLPLHHGKTDVPYNTFKTFMDDGIMNPPCFGTC